MNSWYLAGLSYWRWRSGVDEPIPRVGEEQYRLEMAGEWAAASERWAGGGCIYSTAFSLMDATEEAVLQRALAGLQSLGAKPAAAIFARKLRASGALDVPRGPSPATRANPANLTPRELEVLILLGDGLHNSEIAARLFLSQRTVAHHVSAILHKLGVSNRTKAVTEATRLGIAGPTPRT